MHVYVCLKDLSYRFCDVSMTLVHIPGVQTGSAIPKCAQENAMLLAKTSLPAVRPAHRSALSHTRTRLGGLRKLDPSLAKNPDPKNIGERVEFGSVRTDLRAGQRRLPFPPAKVEDGRLCLGLFECLARQSS